LKPEERARQKIDQLLEASGWIVQSRTNLNLGSGPGIALRELPSPTGPADYWLFVNRELVGAVEAKPEGTTLSGVAEQSKRYLQNPPLGIPSASGPLSFAYESTGVETFFRNDKDPEARSRRVWTFHRPETLDTWSKKTGTLRAGLRKMPPLITNGLRDCQIQAVTNLEESFALAKPRALLQMATGSGKTFTAVSEVYRLIKHADARRVLFLVDRRTLGRQAFQEFDQYVTPDDGRKFTELYNVQHLTSNTLDPVSQVCITTIQRLYSMLSGQPEFAEENEEQSLYWMAPEAERPLEVVYNPALPIETFDFIITDECHRSIYNLWRQALEYFDSFLVGLTATPSKQTFGFFNQNLVTEYRHEEAVADGVNVPYEVYRIKTKITSQGSTVDAGFYVDKRDRETRRRRWERLDEEMAYDADQLDRSVVSEGQIRTVVQTFKDKLFTEIFPGRTIVPKTLIFAKDDNHAEDIVHIVREVFGKGNEFCKKITYRTTGEKTENLISAFRNSYDPRIVVSVDMISTGTDIRPLECLIFMRDVKSRVYFEQMKGRGTRTIDDTELQVVTGDARHKTQFIIVDAVGVTEKDKTDSRPLERKRNVPLEKLLESVALGVRDEATVSSLAGRLARLGRSLTLPQRREIEAAMGGKPLHALVHDLLRSIDPDAQEQRAKELSNSDKPAPEQIAEAAKELTNQACIPFDAPSLRKTIVEVNRRNEQTIDTVSKDEVIDAGFGEVSKDRARATVESFKKFIEDNRDELTALQIIYNQPYAKRHLTYEGIEQLAAAISLPPINLTTEKLWDAYEQLEKSKVRRAGPQKILTNIVSLLRFALGKAEILEPWSETVEARFQQWLKQQRKAGREFASEQIEWLNMIKDHIATTLTIEMEDFELAPFFEKGGAAKVYQIFGPDLSQILDELNEALAA
jgi:type I restriction enzyme, R subunit